MSGARVCGGKFFTVERGPQARGTNSVDHLSHTRERGMWNVECCGRECIMSVSGVREHTAKLRMCMCTPASWYS